MDKNETNRQLLNTKQHFNTLDGMRGVAAIAVVVFHFMEWIYPNPSQNLIGHGFLAVDFFFCLSGFVIGYAYDDRIKKMGLSNFFISRIIRLHPLVILGSILGLLTFLFDPFGGHPEIYSLGKICLTFLCSVLLIPLPIMEDRFYNLFSFNAPAWSLFWEYIANVFYALIFYRIKKNYLFILTLVAATGICYVAYQSGNLLGGWSGPTFWDGGARIAYSFLAGLLIYRSNWIIKNNIGFFGLATLLCFAFLMPSSRYNYITEPFVVLCYFPLLVALGAGTITGSAERICKFAGDISYPLYMTHYAALWMFGNYLTTQKPVGWQLAGMVTLSIITLIGIAYLTMHFFDMPIRNYLRAKHRELLTFKTQKTRAKK